MNRIAFLGMGAMGSRMAVSLINAGYRVTVWNRHPEACKALQQQGACVAPSPRKAAEEADIVFSMVRDDEASHRVWLDDHDGALAGMKSSAIGVECSTLSLPHIRTLASVFEQSGRAFVDAPVAGSRPQADNQQLIFFVGGEQPAFQHIEPLLLAMGSRAHYLGGVGVGVGAGMTVKLMVNGLFGAQQALMAELIAFADKAGISVADAIACIKSTPVCSPAAGLAAEAMLNEQFAAAFPIELVAKDFALIEASAAHMSAELPISRATARIFDQALSEGLGDYNITGVAQLYH
jgi:3-hydroxyisobutyrate dehydrogenase-like beta-hydroxyacid dehydrogenase